jgi:hypothetical protein
LGDNLADVPWVALWHPTCGRADVPCVAACLPFLRMCVGAPNLRMCVGAQPTWARTCLALQPLRVLKSHSNLRTCSLVGRFVAFGRPSSCRRALRCVGAPNLQCCVWVPLDVPYVALGVQPWWGRIKKSTSKPKFVLIHPPARLLA